VHHTRRTSSPGDATHEFGVPTAIELASDLGLLPARLLVYAVEVAETEAGVGLSTEAAAALPAVVAGILGERER